MLYLQKTFAQGKATTYGCRKWIKVDASSKGFNLNRVGNNLIARRILFKKIYQLPKSRIASLKDKIINIPIGEEDIVNTLEMLPRTPTEGGLVEIKLKRKKDYKTPYRQEYIDPEKLFRAIQFLKDQENPFYQNVRDNRDYSEYCEYQDSKW